MADMFATVEAARDPRVRGQSTDKTVTVALTGESGFTVRLDRRGRLRVAFGPGALRLHEATLAKAVGATVADMYEVCRSR